MNYYDSKKVCKISIPRLRSDIRNGMNIICNSQLNFLFNRTETQLTKYEIQILNHKKGKPISKLMKIDEERNIEEKRRYGSVCIHKFC